MNKKCYIVFLACLVYAHCIAMDVHQPVPSAQKEQPICPAVVRLCPDQLGEQASVMPMCVSAVALCQGHSAFDTFKKWPERNVVGMVRESDEDDEQGIPTKRRATEAATPLPTALVAQESAGEQLFTCQLCSPGKSELFMNFRLLRNHIMRAHRQYVSSVPEISESDCIDLTGEFDRTDHGVPAFFVCPQERLSKKRCVKVTRRKRTVDASAPQMPEFAGTEIDQRPDDPDRLVACLWGVARRRLAVEWGQVRFTPQAIYNGYCYQLPYAQPVAAGGFKCTCCEALFETEALCKEHIFNQHSR